MRAVRNDLFDTSIVESRNELLGEDLEEILVSEAAGRVTVAEFVGTEYAKGDTRVLQPRSPQSA